MSSLRLRWCVTALMALAPLSAHAEETPWDPGQRVTAKVRGEARPNNSPSDSDGVYGRFDGDLWLSLGVYAELSHGVRPALALRGLYYHSVGLSLGYADAFDSSAFVRRDGWLNVELRPLFLTRWALDLEFQRPLLDLTLDSLSIGAGAYLAQTSGAPTTHSGVELFAGIGVPLFARASGPWLEARGFLRPALDGAERGALLGLSWYAPVVTPLVR
ncbi:MAG: hypothetical protein QM756_00800 [Polyangiaceae bacterium]